ncbi:MAG: hypothetical protein AVDCRST_MAG43-1600 [uncultured Thermomicrobiales bacterium]|uniref:Uncharacterized protein n=1 Tax=uncultured Thermomicrobiales bacterium TaxID=1645740 RepID=A0A6J4UT67_9BACT|nr:MAG: hypothetical protein AVDCRST_MAG43-1600 [uncultured Thermomicrobiales bacterium]
MVELMNVDFIKIGQRSVRVTSLKEDATSGALTLVVIARGTVDRRVLSELLAAGPLVIDVPDRPAQLMDVTSTDERVVGSGEQAITRFSVELTPSTPPQPGDAASREEESLATRLDRMEATLEEILSILKSTRSGLA